MSISPIHSKPYSPVKKAVKTAVVTTGVAAAATGAVLYLASTGKLNPTEGGNKIIETVKKGLKKTADTLVSKYGELAKGHPSVSAIVDKPKEYAKSAINFVKTIPGKLETVKDSIESKLNPAKFNPEKAGKELINPETFNDFKKLRLINKNV